jgi:hypothetical protein
VVVVLYRLAQLVLWDTGSVLLASALVCMVVDLARRALVKALL